MDLAPKWAHDAAVLGLELNLLLALRRKEITPSEYQEFMRRVYDL